MDAKRKIFGNRGVRGFLRAKGTERKIFGPGGFKSRYGVGKGRGGIKLARIGADLEKIKDQLNVEKKSIEVGFDTTGVSTLANRETAQDERGGTAEVPAMSELYGGDKICDANSRGPFSCSQSKISGTSVSTGMDVKDITPVVWKGDGPHNRNGKKIKFTGMTMRLHYSLPVTYNSGNLQGYMTGNDISTYHNGARGKMYIIHTSCDDVTEQMIKDKFLQKNNHTHVVDYGSERNYDNLSDFKVVYTKRFYVKPPGIKGFDFVDTNPESNLGEPSAATQTADSATHGYKWPVEEQILQCKLKLAHHLRWRNIDDPTSFNGRFFAVFVLDRGNSGSTAGNAFANTDQRTLHGLLPSTGIQLEGAAKWWYVDN